MIQAKHTSDHKTSCSDPAFFKNKSSIAKKEVAKVQALRLNNACDCYLLFANRKGSAKVILKVENYLKEESGVAKVSLIALETLEDYLGRFPHIVRRFRLGQLIDEGHNLPQEMLGDLFVGREHDLKVLGERLAQDTVALTQAVLGTGGIGKTRLALEFAWRSLRKYRFFVNAATPATLQTGIANLVEWLELPELDNQQAQVRSVIQKLQATPDWLLILDNVDDADAQAAVQALRLCCISTARC